MLIAIILAAVVILGGIAVVAMGFGGELAREDQDQAGYPYFQSAADVASYRPPPALLGYDARATEYALRLASEAVADRDAEIAALADRLRELTAEDRPLTDTAASGPAASEPGSVAVGGGVPARPWPAPQPSPSAGASSRLELRLPAERTATAGPVMLPGEDE